jgi:hypothetical protein
MSSTATPPETAPAVTAGTTGAAAVAADGWISPALVLKLLLGICLLLGCAGVPAAWVSFEHDIGEIEAMPELARQFELNTESNIPTWFSSMELFAAMLLALQIGSLMCGRAMRFGRYWFGIALVLAFLSIDEVAMFHEHLGELLHVQMQTSGAMYFAWVLPYFVVFGAIGVCYFRFWLRLPRDIRLLLALSAILFGGGAGGFEMAEGMWATDIGWGRGMKLLTILEETSEMLGSAVCVYALMLHLQRLRATGANAPAAAQS